MKTASAAVQTMLKNDVEVAAKVRLTAEWEHNRFSPIDSITVTPAQTDDVEWLSIYDLDSITLPARPSAGSAKSRFDSDATLPIVGKYRDFPAESRYYISTEFDKYKYWSSTQKTGTTPVSGRYAFTTPIVLTLMYDNPVLANKVVVGFETAYALPGAFTIEVTYNGTTWTTLPVTALNSDGQVILYRSTSNVWSTTPSHTGQINMMGMRLTVSSMNESKSHVDVIQMGLRLEQDLTEFLEDYTTSFDIAERSFVAPLGQSSSNTASVTLSNIDQRFNNESATSLYKGLIGKRARFTCDILLDSTPHGGSPNETIREFTMWVDTWGGQDQASSTVELKDSSVFLQEITIPPVFWENITVGAIIWQLLDISGMTNYEYNRHVLDNSQAIPYFWPEPDITVWDQIGQLAEATQTAVYFDEYDVMQIKTSTAMFASGESVDWSLDAVPNGQKLPDIITSEIQEEMTTNKVTVDYRPAKYSEFNNGFPKMETVWEPEEATVVLRSAPLVKDLYAIHIVMWIRQADAVHWPYESLVNVRGEIIRYKGKQYVWYKPDGTTETKVVYNQEEKDALDDQSHPDLAYKNYFTGKLMITERGVMGSGISDHKINGATYSSVITSAINAYMYAWNGGFVKKDGYAQVTNTATANGATYHIMRHETAVTGPYVMFGTRMQFPRGGHQAGGIWFDGNSLDIGYYLEIATTEHTDVIEKRQWRHELSLSVAKNNTDRIRNVPVNGDPKGHAAAISPGPWYNIDVIYQKSTGNVTVYIDGVIAGYWVVPSDMRPITNEGRFGMYVRGLSQVNFEYIYATSAQTPADFDSTSFFDLKEGSFTSGYIERDWRYDTRFFNAYFSGTRKYYPQMISRANYALDEFGPVVHEMREYDIKFDEGKIPVQHSSLFLSNTSQVACLAYMSNPFGAKFMLVNTSRENAVVQGEDSVTFGSDNTVNQKMFVYGRALYQDEDKSVTKSDEFSIRKNGLAELVFDNRFIQTDAMANALGDWVVRMWAGPIDELAVEIFGNPLLQLGDVVSMNWPFRNMAPLTHKYYVVYKENTFQEGLKTRLVLRRARF
jgi:hypothetical protein